MLKCINARDQMAVTACMCVCPTQCTSNFETFEMKGEPQRRRHLSVVLLVVVGVGLQGLDTRTTTQKYPRYAPREVSVQLEASSMSVHI